VGDLYRAPKRPQVIWRGIQGGLVRRHPAIDGGEDPAPATPSPGQAI
jgi:hypothetical protein